MNTEQSAPERGTTCRQALIVSGRWQSNESQKTDRGEHGEHRLVGDDGLFERDLGAVGERRGRLRRQTEFRGELLLPVVQSVRGVEKAAGLLLLVGLPGPGVSKAIRQFLAGHLLRRTPVLHQHLALIEPLAEVVQIGSRRDPDGDNRQGQQTESGQHQGAAAAAAGAAPGAPAAGRRVAGGRRRRPAPAPGHRALPRPARRRPFHLQPQTGSKQRRLHDRRAPAPGCLEIKVTCPGVGISTVVV